MNIRGKIFVSIIFAYVGLSPLLSAATPPSEVNLQSLLGDIIDRDAQARWPSPSYVLKEASSHDPLKADPSDSKTWHLNGDFAHFIRTEVNESRLEWVILDEQGAGAITRFWTPLGAGKDKALIRFYFDGASIPALTANFFDFISGRAMVRPPFAFISWNEDDLRNQLKPEFKAPRGVGGDLYLPIAFSKSCKITLDQIPFYYVINYRVYDPGTSVRTFSLNEYTNAKPAVDHASEVLLAASSSSATSNRPKETILKPGEEVSLDMPNGPAAVKMLQVQINPEDSPQVLRSTILRAEFDGESMIWCPLGDFFGTGARLQPVRDWQRSASANGVLVANWVMPYQRTARFSLKNVGNKTVAVKLAAATDPWQWNERTMYFHAEWRSEHELKTQPKSDWNYIDINGKGVYVGDTLTVFNPSKQWYGEGDERIYLDGEVYPSRIGTGTEDYYGYAWGMADYFNSPFLSTPKRDIPRKDPKFDVRNGWKGYTTTSRLFILDAIPFQKEFKHDMEIWHWDSTQVDYSVGLFWYGLPGAKSNRVPQPDEAAIAIKDIPSNEEK